MAFRIFIIEIIHFIRIFLFLKNNNNYYPDYPSVIMGLCLGYIYKFKLS